MTVHAVAILKGAVEGDPVAHLGSLLATAHHLDIAERAGLVDGGDSIFTAQPTEAGREFYARYRLAGLPGGRANAWTGELIDAAVAALEG